MQEPQTLNDFIAAEKLTKILGISREVLLGWLDKGLPYIRIGVRLYFHEPAVAAWLKRQETTRQTA